MYAQPRLYVPLVSGFGGIALLTLINYVFYTVVLRYKISSFILHNLTPFRAYYSCTGTLSPKVEVNTGALGFRYEIEQIHMLTESTRSVYEGIFP